MAFSRPSARKKLIFASLSTLTLFAGVEGAMRAAWGAPPLADVISRALQCQVVAGDRVGLDCQPGQRDDVWTTLEPTKPRVVVLGGSSVRSSVAVEGTSFSDELARRVPEIEVLNFGASGLYAANVAVIASQLDALSPDLVVIYSGHNDYGAAAFEGEIDGLQLWSIPIYAVLQESWIYGLLSGRAGRVADTGSEGQPGRTNIVQDGRVFEVREQVDARLAADLALAVESSPAPVVLSTLLRNPTFPPGGVLTEPGSDCARALSAGFDTDFDDASQLRRFRKACGEGAVSSWLEHHVLASAGRTDEAVQAWYDSLDQDALPLRAPPSADRAIRAVAERTGARLLDLEQELGPLADEQLFSDTLHFSAWGNQVVGSVVEGVVREELDLAPADADAGVPPPPAPADLPVDAVALLEAGLDEVLDEHGVSGATVVLIRSGARGWSRHFGGAVGSDEGLDTSTALQLAVDLPDLERAGRPVERRGWGDDAVLWLDDPAEIAPLRGRVLLRPRSGCGLVVQVDAGDDAESVVRFATCAWAEEQALDWEGCGDEVAAMLPR